MGYSNDYTLAYQSKVGPVPWLRPYTDDKIRELGGQGVDKMVVVPISFVSEHIETLEEIDVTVARSPICAFAGRLPSRYARSGCCNRQVTVM